MLLNNSKFKKKKNETTEEYLNRLFQLKDDCNLTWMQVAEIGNEALNLHWSADWYRKW